MDNQYKHYLKKQIRFINHATSKKIFHCDNNPLASFAIDDAIATTVGQNLAPTTFRMWIHKPTIVLGILDARLPYIDEGLAFIKNIGHKAIVRNSGGLAVALDEDVVNMSAILPNAKNTSINHGYDFMYALIQQLLKHYTEDIKAYEIVGSYCPGDYDLSINGKKFAGISQRRVRNGVAVQIYIDVAGDSQKRASIVRQFYDVSKQEAKTKHVYPTVTPHVMASLNQLLQTNFTALQFIDLIKDFLADKTMAMHTELLEDEKDIFMKRHEQMIKRNEHIINIFHNEL